MSVRDRVATYLEKISRRPSPRAICATAALGLFACSQHAGSDLASQYSADSRVAGAAPTVVALDLAAGNYLVEVCERDIELRLVIEAAGKRSEIEDKVPRHGLHAQVVSLPAPSKLRIELHNSEHRDKHGAAHVRVARWRRAAGAEAGPRERGFAAFGAAGEQLAVDTREAWTRAADLLHEAIAEFAAAKDEAARAQAESSLANLEYVPRSEWLPAIRAAERAAEIYTAIEDEVGAH